MSSPEWPELPFAEWESTCDTVHMWTQIVGKTRLALTPLENHWWNTALYVTPRGLTTSAIPYGRLTFEIQFDFIAHKLGIRTSAGAEETIPLLPRSVADFYGEYMSRLRSLGIDVEINPVPVEFDDTTPFHQDQHHASYDTRYVERFRRVLIGADRVLKQFRARFIGKASPVHFFWGSFDLAATRFSGKPAPPRQGADMVTREAYSHEVTSCGFWPGDRRFAHPAFYSYAAPSPEGLDQEPVQPAGAAYWDKNLSEFVLRYDDMRSQPDPHQAALEFFQSTHDAAARLAKWDRRALERSIPSEAR